jgi:hydrogenase-4 component E
MDSQAMINSILLFVLLLNLFILGTSRLGTCIKMVSLQGALLALLPVLMHGTPYHALILSASALLLKGVLIPWLLFRAIREVRIHREITPRIGFIATLLLGALVTAAAFIFSEQLPLLPEHQHSLIIPGALATLCAGALLLVTRSTAITQVLGYLMFENGIFIFGMLFVKAMPLMIEAGVLLDMLVAIFVMGIVMNHINREFSSINTEHLALLKE